MQQPRRLRIAVPQREFQSMLLLQSAGRGQLCGRVVDADGTCAAARHPGRHIGRAAAELDGVLATQVVGQQAQFGFGNVPQTPARLGSGPCALAIGRVLGGPAVPDGTVQSDVFRQFVGNRG